MEQKDGGPAFPVADPFTAHQPSTVDAAKRLAEGMTLRDYFAARAMPAVWADIPEDAARDQALNQLGAFAYEMADAMLAARHKPQ